MDLVRNSILKNENDTVKRVIVLGVGATGSHIVIELVKLGFTDITIYDPAGIVKEHNLTNQVYSKAAVGMSKVEALQVTVQSRYDLDVVNISPILPNVTDYDIIFNCVDDWKARKIYRSQLENYKGDDKLYLETAFGVFTFDVFVVKDMVNCINSIESMVGTENISEVTSPCGSRLSVSASVLQVVGITIWKLVQVLNEEDLELILNKRFVNNINPEVQVYGL